MSLTGRQKSHLWGLLATCVIIGVFAGIGYFLFWACETTSVQHFCSGTTGYTIAQTNGDGTSVSIKDNDPRCR